MEMLLAGFVAALAAFAFGLVWYGPLLGAHWMRLAKLRKKDVQPGWRTFILAYARLLVTALIIVLLFSGIDTIGAMLTVLLVWIAFTAMPALADVIWSKRPLALYMINAAYELLGMLLMVAIITAWL